MMTGCAVSGGAPRTGKRYEVVRDPLGWRVARNGCTTGPSKRRTDAVCLAHRLHCEADSLARHGGTRPEHPV